MVTACLVLMSMQTIMVAEIVKIRPLFSLLSKRDYGSREVLHCLLCKRRGRGLNTATNPYIYHPQTRTMESEVQAMYLTKSVLMDDMPQTLKQSVSDLLHQDIMNSFKRSIIQTRVFSYTGERSTRFSSALPLMLNLQKAVWSHATSVPGLLDFSLSYKPYVLVGWERGENFLQVSGNLGFLLSSKTSLPPFVTEEEIKLTEKEEVEKLDIIAPVFNLHKLQSKREVDTGFYANAPFSHPHTLFLVNTNKKWTTRDHCAQGIMFLFAHLVAKALSCQDNQLGDVLQQPLAAQCITTNGIKTSLICYQLNTLDFKSDDGVKNMVWINEGLLMYKKAKLEELPGLHRKTPTLFEPVIECFNDNFFELFTNMFLNGAMKN